jgi:hypothetical protein
LAYSPGYEQVFLNGVLLSRSGSEYTATNGTSITLTAATVAGDIVEVICPLQIATTDTYTQSAVNNAFQANSNNFAAGKNHIINGDFGVWQRGTSFTSPAGNTYTADRWIQNFAAAPTTYSVTQQTFTPGTAPVSGYEGSTFYRATITTVGSNTAWEHKQRIEDVRSFAGQTVTISFWAKADSSRTGRIFFYQVFGTGGSTAVYSTAYNFSLTSSWQRFTQTVSIASISGKTIGTGSYLEATIEQPAASGSVIDIWGVQVEAGSNATAFQTATGTIQGELQACRRYLPALSGAAGGGVGTLIGYSFATNQSVFVPYFDTPARVAPTGMTVSGSFNAFAINTATAATPTFSAASQFNAQILASHTITAGQGSRLQLENNSLMLFTGCEL